MWAWQKSRESADWDRKREKCERERMSAPQVRLGQMPPSASIIRNSCCPWQPLKIITPPPQLLHRAAWQMHTQTQTLTLMLKQTSVKHTNAGRTYRTSIWQRRLKRTHFSELITLKTSQRNSRTEAEEDTHLRGTQRD